MPEAVQTVQRMMDELPSIEAVKEMNSEGCLNAYMQTQSVYEAFLQLEAEEQVLLTGLEKIEVLFAFFNEGTTALDEPQEVTYTLLIPAEVNANEVSSIEITVSDINHLPDGSSIVLKAESQNNGFLVCGDQAIPYQFTESMVFTSNETQLFSLSLMDESENGKQAGLYQDVITFTATVSSVSVGE